MTRKSLDRIGRAFYRGTCALLWAAAAGTAAAQDAASDYAAMLADVDSMRRHNEQIEQLIESQQTEIESMTAQIATLDATAAEMAPLLDRMFENLQQFVEDDLPFMADERMERIDRLGLMMAQEGNPSEKFRRLLEAYQIELEYGRTMEAYRGTLDDGREAMFVHLGRVTLMYRTADGTESGYYDEANRTWVADPRYARPIEEALGMAEELIAPDLVILPVPVAEETRS